MENPRPEEDAGRTIVGRVEETCEMSEAFSGGEKQAGETFPASATMVETFVG